MMDEYYYQKWENLAQKSLCNFAQNNEVDTEFFTLRHPLEPTGQNAVVTLVLAPPSLCESHKF